MTEKEKMLAGKVYDPTDEELAGLRLKAHKLSQRYNNTFEDEEEKRKQILDELIPPIVKIYRSLEKCAPASVGNQLIKYLLSLFFFIFKCIIVSLRQLMCF